MHDRALDGRGPRRRGRLPADAAQAPLPRAVCRAPLARILHGWRDGARGAFRMGVVNGLWCSAAASASTLALLALGMMSIGWMVLVGAAICVEKTTSRRRRRESRRRPSRSRWERSRGRSELPRPRRLFRVVQLRGDLPVPDDRRRAGRPLDLRRLLRRPLAGAIEEGNVGDVDSSACASRSSAATTTTSRARRGRSCSTSTPRGTTSSNGRCETLFLEGDARTRALPWIRKARHLVDVRTSADRDRRRAAARRRRDLGAGHARRSRPTMPVALRDPRLRPRRPRALRGRARRRRRSVRLGARAETAPTSSRLRLCTAELGSSREHRS